MKTLVNGLVLVAVLCFFAGFAYDAFQDSYFQLLYQSDVVLERSVIDESGKVLGRTGEAFLVSIYTIKPCNHPNLRLHFGWGSRNSRQCLEFVQRRGAMLLGFAGFCFPDQKLADLMTANREIDKILSFEDIKRSEAVTPNVKIITNGEDHSFTRDDFSVPCFYRGDPDFGRDPNTFTRTVACTNAWGKGVAIICIVKK